MSVQIRKQSVIRGIQAVFSTASDAGRRVGRFRLLSELGRGSMGRVFRADDPLLQRQVAIKVLPKILRRGHKTVEVARLIGEARAAAMLDHPHAVRVYEINEFNGMMYIAMELLEGGSLRDLVKAAGPLDFPRACLLCADAAAVLARGHELGIVHRDVKPANLLLTRSGRCKVADFGLARVDDGGDADAALPESVGTPQFVAPELLRGGSASPRSDLYSLGATLWYLLTGGPPFQARTAAELLRKHLKAPLPDLSQLCPDLPAGLVRAVSKALAKNPADRFDSLAQFEKMLRMYSAAADGTSAALAASVSWSEPLVDQLAAAPAAWARRVPSPAFLAAAAAVLVMLGITLAVAVRTLRPSGHPSPDSETELIRPDAAPTGAEPSGAPRLAAAAFTAGPAYPPDYARSFAARGREHARHGRFAEAAVEYASAARLDSFDPLNDYYLACLAAYLGQADLYGATFRHLFTHFSDSSDVTVRDKTAKTCLLLIESGVDPQALLPLANSLPSDGGGNAELAAWFNLCKGMALYRCGRYQESLGVLQRARIPQRAARTPAAECFQAMAQWRLGMGDEARSTLNRAAQAIERSLAKPGVDDLARDGIEDWLVCQVARRQAYGVVGR